MWALAAALTALQPGGRVRRNLGVPLACVLALAFAPIHTDLSTPHFFTLGGAFLAVVLGPALFMRRKAPGVYAMLRGVFPARIANPAQAIIYTSVLYDMAFTGHGIWIVYGFALTQGVMYEKSRVLMYVLIVHLIVDVFLVMAIVQYHYPTHVLPLFF